MTSKHCNTCGRALNTDLDMLSLEYGERCSACAVKAGDPNAWAYFVEQRDLLRQECNNGVSDICNTELRCRRCNSVLVHLSGDLYCCPSSDCTYYSQYAFRYSCTTGTEELELVLKRDEMPKAEGDSDCSL